jgi:hypothetical protein
MPKCFTCQTKLVWQNDFDTEDVGQEDSEFLIVSMYQCPEKIAAHGMKSIMVKKKRIKEKLKRRNMMIIDLE